MKILLIDDNQEITEMVSFYLESLGEIKCRIANDGREGLELIRNDRFDLIITDIAMPEFSGYDIIKALAADGLIRSKYIVVFTASSVSDEGVQELLRLGVKGLIRKPISLEDLEQFIKKFKTQKTLSSNA